MYVVHGNSEAAVDVDANGAHLEVEVLFRAHYSHVARVIARVVRDRGRAEELAVEVFLKLWRRREVLSDGHVQGWLYRVALRTALDEVRKQTRRGRYDRLFNWVRPRPAQATPEEIHSASEEHDRVRLVLSVLEPRQAQFLVLRMQDFSYEEVADILNVNPASVGTLLGRAQEAFRKEYIKRYGDEA